MGISNTVTTAQPGASVQTRTVTKSRIASIDVMRGLVMVFMLVDHVRERFYYHKQVSDPMDIDVTTPDLFFTRMTAHLCAPVFVFLTGLSAWLYAHPSSGERSPSGFLFKRGLFLVLLEVTLVNFSWMGNFDTIWLQVIWVIGLSMIVLAGMVKLPYWFGALVGFLIVFGHNALTPLSFAPGETGYTLWTILHDRGFLLQSEITNIKASYPLLPWIGVILLGYTAGPIYARTMDALTRKQLLLKLGLSCLAILAVLRGFNIYGETLPWTYGETWVQTLMSLMNFTKYPPSLDFLLLTLGISFLLMRWFESQDNWLTRALKTYGSAPMFFYLFHLYILLIGYNLLLATVGPNQGELFGVDQFWWIWVVSVLFTVALYAPTKAFSDYKSRSKQAWIRYF